MDTYSFVGAWRLLSLETLDEHGDPTYPLGRDAVGLLTYTATGYMCLAIMDPHRPAFASDDRFAATAEELGAAGLRYWSYAGRWEAADGVMRHHVEVSLIPNWVGTTLERACTLEGDRLTLAVRRSTLVWERIAAP
jgi:hypothetical protein